MAKRKGLSKGKVKVGIVGCGNICDVYFKNMMNVFEVLEVTACADAIPQRAKAKAEEYKIRALSVGELVADDDVEIVVNLTPPAFHYEVAKAAIGAGKNVHNEKPLSIKREEGKKLLSSAKAKGVRTGCAPDTFLGGGLQTCRKLIDDGWIGKPVAATAFMTGRGPERWHPSPEFFYKTGGGPLFDMGPYYITALVNMLGPIRQVTSVSKISFPERLILSQPLFGKKIKVEVPTHVAGVMEFESGAVATLITSFDVWKAELPRIEIYGSEASLQAPDPNTFGGPVRISRAGEWREAPLSHGYEENSRGIAVADMAYGLISGRKHRASGELAYHVLDVMHALYDASRTGRHVEVKSSCERPAALPVGLRKGVLDQ